MLGFVGDVDEDADEFVAIRLILVAPAALYLLAFTRDRTELLLQFE